MECSLPDCKFAITKERLGVMKFAQDLVRSDGTPNTYFALVTSLSSGVTFVYLISDFIVVLSTLHWQRLILADLLT